MCGICGIYEHRTGAPVDRARVKRMSDALTHRGPDDEGFFFGPGVGIANRRLSIIDVAGGRQPLANEDGTVQVVLNGEIYNFQALQRELEARGHTLRTRSDTEVLVHLYEDFGDDFVARLDGMFAFALYDSRPGRGPRLLVGRDRLGKKPLYYADVEGALVFGSELKSVLLDPRVPRELDPQALHHYLTLLMVPTPFSIFRAVRKLSPGHVLVADRAGVRARPYWRYLDHVDTREVPEEEVLREVRRLLFAAVEKRLIAEVPLGAFLSGGLDSSTVVAVMSRLKREPVRTFSIGFEGPATHNELPHAELVARQLGTDHHAIVSRPDIVELIPEIITYADEPFAISSAIPTFLIAKAAREKVTVVLTGDGGDETFGGYGGYLYERWARAWRVLPRSLDRVVTAGMGLLGGRVDGPLGRSRSRVSRFVSTSRQDVVSRRLGWVGGLDERAKASLYARFPAVESTESFLWSQLQGLERTLPPERFANVLDTLVWLPDEMLTKVDRMTMAASVEARCPLLDLSLVEYLAGLPFRQKIPGWTERSLKHLLRRAVADLLPFDRLKFRKWGFNVPLDLWFRTGARSYLESKLNAERVKRHGIFDPKEVEALVARHMAGGVNAANHLYALLVFDLWAEVTL
ncbi:MAG: asparagine synthase (glutamine-hydrolyzing) [Deltaproteobacteria bacterium]|nr:asparagine synthase (glutamine-hydrolyzing) [Deltaproteobacteria bacterium]